MHATTRSAATIWKGIDIEWAYSTLLRSILRHTRCRHRAKDALHDAFVRFAVSPAPGRLDQPHAYFRRVVDSVLCDGHRERSRQPLLIDDLGPARAAELELAAQGLLPPSPEALFALRQRLALLQRLVDDLPPRCREVFWLFRIEGFDQAEIAARLGISVNMVERHVMRALVDLRAARDSLAA